VKHGAGRRWYLEAANYADDLLNDARRRDFMRDFLGNPAKMRSDLAALEQTRRLPAVARRAIARRVSSQMKRVHFGQILPMEDVERIFDLVTSVVRMPCFCREVTQHKEAPFCFAVSMVPEGGRVRELVAQIDASYLNGPDSCGLEVMDKPAALEALRDLEKRGLCHSVWTFIAPFIGGICNCDRMDCAALKVTLDHDAPTLFRAEYVAAIDPGECNGCRSCMRVCHFGAIQYSVALQKASIDPRQCYGCGICRTGCVRNAISLSDRREVPAAAGLW